jgi:hypothetical protein
VPDSPTAVALGSLHGRPVLTAGAGDRSPGGSDAGGRDAGGSDAGSRDAGGRDIGGSDAGGSDAGGRDTGNWGAGGWDIGVWDVGTGTRAHTARVAGPPLASRPGPGGHLYVTTDDGSLTDLTIPARAMHPVARRRRPCRCGHHRHATPRTQRDALELAAHWPVTDPPLELVELNHATWVAVHRCPGCGQHWAEESMTSGHAELYFGYPIHTDDPHGWLARANSLKLSR